VRDDALRRDTAASEFFDLSELRGADARRISENLVDKCFPF
jgi:hypothetical protein